MGIYENKNTQALYATDYTCSAQHGYQHTEAALTSLRNTGPFSSATCFTDNGPLKLN